MKKIILTALFLAPLLGICAQNDSTYFKGHFANEEYGIYLNINLYQKNIIVPAHDLFGELPGYLGKVNNNFVWVITDSEIISPNKANISLINDFGSEDLSATLIKQSDSIFVLKQGSGSTIKMPNKGKWQKIPKEVKFKKTRRQ